MNYFHFTHKGVDFVGYVERDPDYGAPWEEHDGHGRVRVMTHRLDGKKRPGERVLHQDGRTVWLYDWQAACKTAKKDGWNAAPYDAPGRVARAVQADFDRLRGWLLGEWLWVGVCVRRADAAPDSRYSNALWGIESDSPEYHRETALELAEQILA